MASDPPLLVCAIDFGTTFSGWAYSTPSHFKTDPTKAFTQLWHSGSGTLSTEKTPTSVLIRPDGKTLEAFGYDAEDRFRELTEDGQHEKFFYFEKFKMKLHTDLSKAIKGTLMLEDATGKFLPGIDVFALSIKFLVDDMLSSFNKRINGIFKKSEINIVLTVPAIWTDASKQFMRRAAEQAGVASERLSIVLEPEAASIFCRYLPLEKATGGSIATLPVGTRFLVLDAGGGTVDIILHEINANGSMKEIAPASGGGWGSTMVDKAFEDLVADQLGENIYSTFKRENKEDWIDFIREFEHTKRNMDPKKVRKIAMRFPVVLKDMWELENNRKFELKTRGQIKDIEVIRDKMKFPVEIMRALFKGSNEMIVQHLKDILKDASLNVDAILMVGGYSESPVLQHAVTSAFPEKKVVIPHEASLSILKGALIYGHDIYPQLTEPVTERVFPISDRVLKYTYGVETTTKFEEGKHPESKRMPYANGDCCIDIFSIHVRKGQSVTVGKPQVKKTYRNTYDYQESVTFDLYATESSNPKYVDEAGCNKIGSVRLTNIEVGPDWIIELTLTFSGTEIEVRAGVKGTMTQVKATADFLG